MGGSSLAAPSKQQKERVSLLMVTSLALAQGLFLVLRPVTKREQDTEGITGHHLVSTLVDLGKDTSRGL